MRSTVMQTAVEKPKKVAIVGLPNMEGLQVRPGTMIKLHQTYPTFVIECEGAHIVLDTSVASSVCAWKTPKHEKPTAHLPSNEKKHANNRLDNRIRLSF
ncbi:MAG: hypothetical protein V3R78_11235 [Thermodesulfobacteriota bacterium]